MKVYNLKKQSSDQKVNSNEQEKLAKVLYFGIDKLHQKIEHFFQDKVDEICFVRKQDMVGREYSDFRFKFFSNTLLDLGYSTDQAEELLSIWGI